MKKGNRSVKCLHKFNTARVKNNEVVEHNCMVCVCVHTCEAVIKKTWQKCLSLLLQHLQVTVLDFLIHSQTTLLTEHVTFSDGSIDDALLVWTLCGVSS